MKKHTHTHTHTHSGWGYKDEMRSNNNKWENQWIKDQFATFDCVMGLRPRRKPPPQRG